MAIEARYSSTDPRPRVEVDQFGQPMRVETGREARQGPLGRPILYVLLGGLALAALYLIGTMIWSNSEDLPPPNQIQEEPAAATTPAVNMTPADPVVTPAPTTLTPAPAPAPVTPAPATPAPVTPAG